MLIDEMLLFFVVDTELAASVPKTEIVGKSEYFRFGMRDSLAIEACFLQVVVQFLTSWFVDEYVFGCFDVWQLGQ